MSIRVCSAAHSISPCKEPNPPTKMCNYAAAIRYRSEPSLEADITVTPSTKHKSGWCNLTLCPTVDTNQTPTNRRRLMVVHTVVNFLKSRILAQETMVGLHRSGRAILQMVSLLQA